eukprot:g4595.t1
MHDLRKSCDQCNRAKRKCDGEHPCSRCTNKEAECTYSKRRPRTCTTYRPRRRRTLMLASATGAALHGHRDPADRGTTIIKRCRLSASPATGLVGMQENLFLSDFFGCIGFLPLTTESDVREAMVKIMLSSKAAAARKDCGEEDDSGTIEGGLDPGWALAGGNLPIDPSTCAFWCAVAMGALVKGRAIESVSHYTKLAKEALAGYVGPANAEVAKAWAMLAYLHGIAGDLATFHEHLAISERCISEIAQGGAGDKLPVGFPEVVRHGETIKLFTGTAGPEEVETFLAQRVPLPEISVAATEGEMCRYIMLSYRAFEQNVHEDKRLANFWNIKNGDTRDVEALNGDSSSSSSDSSVDGQSGVEDDLHSHVRPCIRPCPGFLARLKMQLRDRMGFGRLEAAVERPRIRAGVGGVVINGTLVFEKAANGDLSGAIERLSRCVEVFERYPGLHRFAMGEHMGHVMIQLAASMDDPRAGELYQRLRCAFNVTRPPGAIPFPPLEDWQGVAAYCNNLPCRMIPKILPVRRMGLSLPASLSDSDTSVKSGESWGVDSPAQQWQGSVSECEHDEARGAFRIPPEPVGRSPLDDDGAVTSPDASRTTDEETQDHEIAAEDWLEATQALGFALGVGST